MFFRSESLRQSYCRLPTIFLYPNAILTRSDIKNTRWRSGYLVFFGGDEGNRTPVRKRIHKTFSERSYLLGFPTKAGR